VLGRVEVGAGEQEDVVGEVAREVQVFWPLMTHSSPSSTAEVRTPARSEPASGSE
jgi:hypothetical protein